MKSLADDTSNRAELTEQARGSAESAEDDFEGNLRAMGQSAIEKAPQDPETQELMEVLCGVTERAGFEPAVPEGTPVFETGPINRSGTSPECLSADDSPVF